MLSQELQVAVLDNEIYELTTPQARKQSQVMFDLPQPSESREPLMDEVQDLCSSLDQARQASKTLKLYLSQHGTLSGCHTSPVPARGIHSECRTQELVTLEQFLLQTPNNRPISLKWSPMMLSFILASSLLQLCSTPWMAEPWTKQTICFGASDHRQMLMKPLFLSIRVIHFSSTNSTWLQQFVQPTNQARDSSY